MRFWDSSALIQLFVDQTDTEFVRQLYLDGSPVVVWWGTQVECVRAFCKLSAESVLPEQSLDLVLRSFAGDWKLWFEIEPADEVRKRANDAARKHLLRAADALQLGAALFAQERAGRQLDFVCFDKKLGKAAASEGLRVIDDGDTADS